MKLRLFKKWLPIALVAMFLILSVITISVYYAVAIELTMQEGKPVEITLREAVEQGKLEGNDQFVLIDTLNWEAYENDTLLFTEIFKAGIVRNNSKSGFNWLLPDNGFEYIVNEVDSNRISVKLYFTKYYIVNNTYSTELKFPESLRIFVDKQKLEIGAIVDEDATDMPQMYHFNSYLNFIEKTEPNVQIECALVIDLPKAIKLTEKKNVYQWSGQNS